MGPSSPKMGKMISDLVKDKESRVERGGKILGNIQVLYIIFSFFVQIGSRMTNGLRLALKIHSLFTVHV